MKVSVIIPAWNLWSMTAACLESLAANTGLDAIETIVVDNGSSDETASQLEPLGRKLFGANFIRVRHGENLGFARACNAGAARAGGEYLFFLNNDATLSEGWLAPLLKAFSNSKTGACGPLLLYPGGDIQHCGICFDPFMAVSHLYQHFPGAHPLGAKKRPLQAITGAALMIPTALFQSLGGFDDAYQNGFEDMDLCFRLLQAGKKLAVEPESLVCHHESATPGRFANDRENSRLLGSRWSGIIRPDLHLFAHMDGYECSIQADLGLRLEAGKERSAELLAKNADMRPEKLLESMDEEPLWREGWPLLAKSLANAGRADLAISQALRGLRFFPEKELLLPILEIARKNPRVEIARAALPSLAADLADMGAPPSAEEMEKRKAKAAIARRRALKAGDFALADMLENWLGKFGREEPDRLAK